MVNTEKSLNSKSIGSEKEDTQNSYWYTTYSIKTDKITIATVDYTKQEPHKVLKHIVDIESIKDIKSLTDTIDFSSWVKVKKEEEYRGVPFFYIIFNNGTMIRMYSDIPYGGVMEYNEKNGSYEKFNYRGNYKMPKEFLIKVWELVKPYSEQLDREPYHE